jgi:hypothetical protein
MPASTLLKLCLKHFTILKFLLKEINFLKENIRVFNKYYFFEMDFSKLINVLTDKYASKLARYYYGMGF